MPHKRISPTFLGTVPTVSNSPKKKKTKKVKKIKKLQEQIKARRERLDQLLSTASSAPAIPDSVFEANRKKGNRQFHTEEDVLRHYAKMERKQLEEEAKKDKPAKKKVVRTKRFGTTPIPPPPSGKTGVRGHWRKKA
jgi:hypothetical protein